MWELEKIDKSELISRLVSDLPEIRERYSLTYEKIEKMTNIGARRIAAIEEGRQEMRWNEFLSIVFILWSNDSGRNMLRERGLFPPEMERAFSVNRNEHDGTIS